MNGHITKMIHSRREVAEQLLFATDVCQTIRNLADRLADCLYPFYHNESMTLISPGIYYIRKLHTGEFTQTN